MWLVGTEVCCKCKIQISKTERKKKKVNYISNFLKTSFYRRLPGAGDILHIELGVGNRCVYIDKEP